MLFQITQILVIITSFMFSFLITWHNSDATEMRSREMIVSVLIAYCLLPVIYPNLDNFP